MVGLAYLLSKSALSDANNDSEREEVFEINADSAQEMQSKLLESGGIERIVFINTDSVWENYQKVIDMKDDLIKEKLYSEDQYKRQIQKLEKEVTEFRARARFQSQAEIEKKQQELMMQEQELMQLEEQLSMKLAQSERDKNQAITQDVREICKQLAKENDYLYIMSYSDAMASELIFADVNKDISAQVLELLNANYKKNTGQ